MPAEGSNHPPGRGGTVVLYSHGDAGNPRNHDFMTRMEIGKRLAALTCSRFQGEYEAGARYATPLYFVPGRTLRADVARQLGIVTERDLYGGVVPLDFVAGKTITHPLVAPDAAAPQGWCESFCEAARDVVLPGYSAFSREDVRTAGRKLLARGAVRIKPAEALGGRGQYVVRDAAALDKIVEALDPTALARSGAVVEENLYEVRTCSVGQVRVGAACVSYYGTQKLTSDNTGQAVYGGSDLTVVPGDFDALLALALTPAQALAVEQARTYDRAAFRHFPGLVASRRNYDVAQGLDGAGRWRSGVLEQSWRLGGASGPELSALEAFRDDPALEILRASSIEIYGRRDPPPKGASVYFHGEDDRIGWITKYTVVKGRHADA